MDAVAAQPSAEPQLDLANDTAREPVRAPESRDTVVTTETREPVRPPEAHVMPQELEKPTQTPGQDTSSSLIILPDIFQRAEQKIALLLGGNLDPQLAKDLVVDLEAKVAKDQTHFDLVIKLKGPLVEANPQTALQAIEVLRAEPIFAPCFDAHEKPHAQHPEGTPRDEQQIHIPGLSQQNYADLVRQLAGEQAQSAATHAATLPPHPPTADEPKPQPPQADEAVQPATLPPHPPAADEPKPTQQATGSLPALDSTIVQGPGMAQPLQDKTLEAGRS